MCFRIVGGCGRGWWLLMSDITCRNVGYTNNAVYMYVFVIATGAIKGIATSACTLLHE